MPDEKNGDELFEDLDKFFAPIRDVDWDEPEEPAAVTPAEEHVSVRTEHAPPAEPPQAEPPPPSRRGPKGLPRTRARGTTPGSSSRSTRSWASRTSPRS